MTAFLAGPGPRAFAHRGWHIGDLAGYENSMAAFARAVQEGFHYLETDVHLTADGVLIAFHDRQLDRVTDSHGAVGRLPYSAIQQARIGGREPIPLFTDVLELLREHPEVRLNIDPKTNAVVGPLVDLIRTSGLGDRVCVGAFSDARLAVVTAALGPGLATSLGPVGVVKLVGSAMLGTRFSSTAVAAQVPVKYGPVPVVTPRFLAAAGKAGLEVHVWTIDDRREMVRLLDLGVDGIMTDRPDVLREVLIGRNQWR